MANARRSFSLFQTLTLLVFAWQCAQIVYATGSIRRSLSSGDEADLEIPGTGSLIPPFVDGSVNAELSSKKSDSDKDKKSSDKKSGKKSSDSDKKSSDSDKKSSDSDKKSKDSDKKSSDSGKKSDSGEKSSDSEKQSPDAGIPVGSPIGGSGGTVFDVTQFGAKADGKTDNAQAFIKAWNAACKTSTAPSKVVVPAGTFMVGPVVFAGPCKSSGSITFEVKGTLKATTDISDYSSPEWFLFDSISGLVITGGGVFDGQGAASWPYNNCKKDSFCQTLPISLKFNKMTHTHVNGITSLNSKGFHSSLYNCFNFTAHNLHITAPDASPNTDGMHVSSSKLVDISHSIIGTGDDCVSIGQGSEQVTVANVTCGPGHGISIGSLGKYPNEKSVHDVHVKNCTLINTTNGARIKTWGGKITGEATGIIFEDIMMQNVKNPIIIDQYYGSRKGQESNWKISDVHFKNIHGSSGTNVAVSLQCSKLFPCEGVELKDINLTNGGANLKNSEIVSACTNVKVSVLGLQIPPLCP